jgi:hypothetical protein
VTDRNTHSGQEQENAPAQTGTTKGAARMRRLRARRQAGAFVVKALIPAEVVAKLVALGWLRQNAAPADVRQAFLRMANHACRMDLPPPHA